MQTVWQWVGHAPVWDAEHRCVRCGATEEGRAIHDREWSLHITGAYVEADQ